MFILTFIVTIAGITKVLPIDQYYLENLFWILVVELIGCVMGLFKEIFLGKGTDNITKFQLIFIETIDIANPKEIKANYSLTESDITIDAITGSCRVYRDGLSLYFDIKNMPLDKNLLAEIEINGKVYQGSQHLKTRPIYMTLRQDV